ncbi:hypothetical protein ABT230_003037 [Providencia rettgeri]
MKNKIYIAFIISLIYSPFLYFLSDFYIHGDQYKYNMLYDILKSSKFIDGYSNMPSIIGSGDPVYYIISWVGAQLLEKNIYFFLINFFFTFLISLLILKYNTYKYFIFLFLTNFYFLFLALGAERNKISILFLLLFILTKSKNKYIFILASLLSHLSSIILILLPLICKHIFNKNGNLNIKATIKKNSFFLSIIAFIILLGIIFVFKNSIYDKLNAYSQELFYIESLKILVIFLLVPLIVNKNDCYKVMFMMFSLSIIALFIGGGGRFMMFGFLLISFYAIKTTKVRFTYLILLLYFSFKSIGFIENLVLFGDPFALISNN